MIIKIALYASIIEGDLAVELELDPERYDYIEGPLWPGARVSYDGKLYTVQSSGGTAVEHEIVAIPPEEFERTRQLCVRRGHLPRLQRIHELEQFLFEQ